jgi:hypothetical protein
MVWYDRRLPSLINATVNMKISKRTNLPPGVAAQPLWSARALPATLLPLLLSGCAIFQGSVPSVEDLLESGSIGLSRPIPGVAALTSRQPLLGFMPTKHTQRAPRLEVYKNSDKMVFVTHEGERRELKGVGLETLQKGAYSIALKQHAPLWYAPDSYFESRGLEVPPEGSKERFRRGALGAYTVFLNDQTPIHSGPAACADLQGIQMAEGDLKGLFEALEIGMAVEVL